MIKLREVSVPRVWMLKKSSLREEGYNKDLQEK